MCGIYSEISSLLEMTKNDDYDCEDGLKFLEDKVTTKIVIFRNKKTPVKNWS